MTPAPTRLRYEHLGSQVLGSGPERPRLSWRVEGESPQQAYAIEAMVDGRPWSSGRIDSGATWLVEFPGPLPRPGGRADWRVRVWTERGESPWSDWALWEPLIVDWSGRWIAPDEAEAHEPGRRPTAMLATTFSAPTDITRARLYVTAHGVYEAHLNGLRIGDLELTPGFTQYEQRLQVQAFNVTEALQEGVRNLLLFELSDGWFRGEVGVLHLADQWGASTALLAELVIESADGRTTRISTGPQWRSSETDHLADIIEGETIDLRSSGPEDLGGDADLSRWSQVRVATIDDHLVASPAPGMRVIERLSPMSIRPLGDRWIVDFGQNVSGRLRMSDLGSTGDLITVTFGEELDPTGDVTQVNLEPNIPILTERLSAGQVDHVISNGDPATRVETRHSVHGFRYARIEGLHREPTVDDLQAVVVHTDLRRTGTFACSDERLNRLHDAVVWSFRGNAVDIPTDCPVRERAGWTGDWQIFVPTAAYLYDVAGFGIKWLRDLAAGQRVDGLIFNMAPNPPREAANEGAAFMVGSAGWGDAAVIVPWELYAAYGDEAVLAEFWPMMERWVGFATRAAETGRHPSRIERSAEPRPHERYLWDSGFHFGEWLEPQPSGDFDFGALMRADKGPVATAYLRHSTRLLARAAAVLGRDADAARYVELSEKVREAWCVEFLDDNGEVAPATQADCARALAFDLVTDAGRDAVAAQLARLVRKNGDHLSTGFLATPLLLPALADAGHADVAFDLLLQDTWPSWLDMIEQGATTMWERWEGFKDGLPFESHNHYSKGAVATFLHRQVAGIRPLDGEPAYRRFAVHPVLGGGLDWAEGSLDTPYGVIRSAWRRVGDEVSVEVTVPLGTRCLLTLPDGTVEELAAGSHQRSAAVT